MKKINKVTIFFLGAVLLLWFLFWQGVQSQSFAQYISNKVTQSFEKNFGIKVSFKRVEFELFPPGINFHQFRLHPKKIDKLDLEADLYLKKFRVSFNILDFFANKISIKTIGFDDGLVRVKGLFKERRQRFKNLKELMALVSKRFNLVQSKASSGILPFNYAEVSSFIKENIPIAIRSIEFKDMSFQIDDHIFDIHKVALSWGRPSLNLQLDVKEIDLEKKFSSMPYAIDAFKANIALKSHGLEISNFEIYQKLNLVKGRVVLLGNVKDKNSLKLGGELNGLVDLLQLEKSLGNPGVFFQGRLEGKMSLLGTFNQPDFVFEGSIDHLKSLYFRMGKLDITLRKSKDILWVDKVIGQDESESIELKNSFSLYDFKQGKIIDNTGILQLRNLDFKKALTVIEQSVYPVYGNFSGPLSISWNQNELGFAFGENSILTNFRLNFETEKDLLAYRKFSIDGTNIQYLLDQEQANIDGRFQAEYSLLHLKGHINGKEVQMYGQEGPLDIEEIGPIAGTEIRGRGQGKFDIVGTTDDNNISINFDVDLEKSYAFNINLGHFNGKISFKTLSDELLLSGIRGELGKSKFLLGGKVIFGDSNNLDLSVDFPVTNITDSREIYKDLFKDSFALPEKFAASFRASYKIQGPFDNEEFRVFGDVASQNIFFQDESFSSLSFNFNYQKNLFQFSDIHLRKTRGDLKGDFDFNSSEKKYDINLSYSGFELRDFEVYKKLPFGLNGFLDGEFSLRGSHPNLEGRAKLSIYDSVIYNQSVVNSVLDLRLNKSQELFIEGGLLGSLTELTGKLDLAQGYLEKSKKSHLNFRVNTSDPEILAGLFNAENIKEKNMKGVVEARAKTSFNIQSINHLDAELEVGDFYFARDDIDTYIESPGKKIQIKNGDIVKWNFNLLGQGLIARSQGEGSFYENFKISSTLEHSSSISELLLPFIQETQGKITSSILFEGNKGKLNTFFMSRGNKIFMTIKDIPGTFSEVEYALSLNNKKLLIEELKGKYGGGDFDLKGVALFSYPYPLLDLSYHIDNAAISLWKKSRIVVSSDGFLKGQRPPYNLKSKVVFKNGQIYDELSDISSSGGSFFANRKYLPIDREEDPLDLINLDIGLVIPEGVELKNSLAEINFLGSLIARGSIKNPEIDGVIRTRPGSSRFFFKSNDFVISKGEVVFEPGGEGYADPYFSFVSTSQINDYSINMGIFGKASNFNIDLSSEPPLNREDILSLLTIGITGDISQDIQESDRDSITSLGIGSLLFDRFQINQGLKSSLGLRLSVGPELEESNESFLTGRSSGDSSSVGSRYRTGTKIKLEKNINDALDLSVSSTVGGSVSQKQEMILNFELNNNVSVQGVYELKTTTDSEQQEKPDSLGGDLKFKWTFD